MGFLDNLQKQTASVTPVFSKPAPVVELSPLEKYAKLESDFVPRFNSLVDDALNNAKRIQRNSLAEIQNSADKNLMIAKIKACSDAWDSFEKDSAMIQASDMFGAGQKILGEKSKDGGTYSRMKISEYQYLYYEYSGRPRPQLTGFDKYAKPIAFAFAAVGVAAVTAGVGTAVLGVAAPSATTIVTGAVPAIGGIAKIPTSSSEILDAVEKKSQDALTTTFEKIPDTAMSTLVGATNPATVKPKLSLVKNSPVSSTPSSLQAGFSVATLIVAGLVLFLIIKRN